MRSSMLQNSNSDSLSDFKQGFALGVMAILFVVGIFVSIFQVNVTW